MKKFFILMCTALFLMVAPLAAMADSISPTSFSADLEVGESVTITKTVTITALPPTSAKVDVFFLADTTGSMGGAIANVKSAMASILTATSGLGDVVYGVGAYQDIYDTYIYERRSDLTNNLTNVQNAINTLAALNGGDTPEANLYALQQAATTTSWRNDSTRILVWFGDAPGHDPSQNGVTEAIATSALTTAKINVQAIETTNYPSYQSLDWTGQATRITNATGGHYYSTNPGDAIGDLIKNAIGSVFSSYKEVSLKVEGSPDNVTVAFTPGSYTGSFDRSIDRTFTFDVTFTGDTEGTDDFYINALVDGGIVAREIDKITVGVVPEPATFALLGIGLIAMAGVSRKKN